MAWFTPFTAIFFDLDGLLVNTEELHWHAYRDMCRANGCELEWSFETYYSIANRSAHGLQDHLSAQFPQIFAHKSWDQLYQEKRAALHKRVQKDKIPLMPGVQAVISSLQQSHLPIVVVTHSPRSFVEHIIRQHDCLSLISRWVTREDYHEPKPSPDGYLTACRFLGVKPQDTIGFEDSLRGIEALLQAGCFSVLVQMKRDREHEIYRAKGAVILQQIDEILKYTL